MSLKKFVKKKGLKHKVKERRVPGLLSQKKEPLHAHPRRATSDSGGEQAKAGRSLMDAKLKQWAVPIGYQKKTQLCGIKNCVGTPGKADSKRGPPSKGNRITTIWAIFPPEGTRVQRTRQEGTLFSKNTRRICKEARRRKNANHKTAHKKR